MTENDDQELELQLHDGLDEKSLKQADPYQVLCFFQHTPKKFIKQKPSKGNSGTTCRICGGKRTLENKTCPTCKGKGIATDYVEGWYIRQVLNMATGFKWQSHIERTWREDDMVLCQGSVTIELGGNQYTQSSIGKAEIKFRQGTDEPLDLGDAYKTAATDLIKRCAMQWGIACDVYSNRVEEDL